MNFVALKQALLQTNFAEHKMLFFEFHRYTSMLKLDIRISLQNLTWPKSRFAEVWFDRVLTHTVHPSLNIKCQTNV